MAFCLAGMCLAPYKRLVRLAFIPTAFISLALLSVGVVPIAGEPRQEPAPADGEPKVFEVVARRFEFEPATIEVTEGDRVRLVVRSADGPHGVEIKAFKVKKAVPRAKPGDAPITIEFVATSVGEFPILCSEYCGNGHEDMKGTLVVKAKAKGGQ
jgi:heme/copper-type cytochrome/quinol oxidase subunit 2